MLHPAHMNEVIWQFRLSERASLHHLDPGVVDVVPARTGLWDQTVSDSSSSQVS